MAPLILTLALNPEAEVFFDALRKTHFPAERNFLNAHLTLFHHLPHAPEIMQEVATHCEQQQVLALQVVDVVSTGRGVACKIKSEALQQLHKRMQQQWQPWLTPQDKQTLWPHITVQNKATPQTASALLKELKSSFSPFEANGLGLRLWKYLGGPWELVHLFLFNNVH